PARDDTVRVVANPGYQAGSLRRFFLGRSYRDLWAAPIDVPVLDLGSFAGGLTPTETGGGNQTLSLRFRGADGKEYGFRSVDKDPGRGTGGRGGPAGWLLRDQVSSQNPAGALVAGRLMDATGALHVHPQLFVMPDDPRLGEFREQFAGMLGQMEERPDDGFGGSPKLEDTEDFLQALLADPRNRLAAEELLAVRLMDIYLGDWDRHEDQYEWARFDQRDGTVTWRALPRDRDYVFVDYDGLLLDVARPMLEKAVRFHPDYEGVVYGLVEQGQYLDRRLLGGLDRAAWERAAAGLRARLTDALIDDAVRQLPPAYQALEGARLAATLRARRDRLPEAAQEWYRMMAGEPEAHGTDGTDVAIIERSPDALDVRIHAGSENGPVLYQRHFVRGETREVRVFLHGGDDRAEVRGEGGMLVRVIGAAGDDRLEDRGHGARTAFFDDDGRNTLVRGGNTAVDTRPFDTPRYELTPDDASDAVDPPRDWGVQRTAFSPMVGIRPFADVVVGVGPKVTRYGFRRYPWATRWQARALYAPLYNRWGAEAQYTRRWTGSASYGYLFARASQMEASYFTGYGNETGSPEGDRRYILWENQLLLEPGVVLHRPGGLSLNLAALLRYTDPEPENSHPLLGGDPAGGGGTPVSVVVPYGQDTWVGAGARAALAWDRRDNAGFPRRGWTLSASVDGFPYSAPGALDEGEEVRSFARTGAVGTAYVPLAGSVLAVRAGGQAVLGDFPLQYAAFLGGSPTVRGYTFNRYAGDAMAFGSAELRVPVAGPVGVLALADAGRVWYDGESAGDWHTGVGGGGFVRAGSYTASLLYAYGERGIVYLRLGLPF
ncbi:BamA/TamA family outer membrane protein, partial [Longimicrobium sp.]|uniref:BamA/TamA family outer membrane protein n=1 Tax=Longimicrobium sp. TaxID=2029185 RepID=UPI002E33BEF1